MPTPAVFTVLGLLPLTRYSQLSGWKDPNFQMGFVCQVGGFPVFVTALLFWREFLWAIGSNNISMFLDKTCIHQEDPEALRSGIERLGAFLKHSDKMLVLYSEIYLSKLWTTYEVHMLVALGIAWLFTALISATLHMKVGSGGYMFVYVFGALCGGALFLQCRSWELEKRRIKKRVHSFRVQDCTCAVESDRPLVYRNISRLMRACNSVEREASEELALSVFNSRVRSELMEGFQSCMGQNQFGFWYYPAMGWLLSGGRALDVLGSLSLGLDSRVVLCYVLAIFAWAFGAWIFLLLLTERLAGSNLHWRGGCVLLWCFVSVLGVVVLGLGWDTILQEAEERAESSDIWLIVLIFLTVLSVLLAALLGRGGISLRHVPRRQQDPQLSETPADIPKLPHNETEETDSGLHAENCQLPGRKDSPASQTKNLVEDVEEVDEVEEEEEEKEEEEEEGEEEDNKSRPVVSL